MYAWIATCVFCFFGPPVGASTPVAAGFLTPLVGVFFKHFAGRSRLELALTSAYRASITMRTGSTRLPTGFSHGNFVLINNLATGAGKLSSVPLRELGARNRHSEQFGGSLNHLVIMVLCAFQVSEALEYLSARSC